MSHHKVRKANKVRTVQQVYPVSREFKDLSVHEDRKVKKVIQVNKDQKVKQAQRVHKVYQLLTLLLQKLRGKLMADKTYKLNISKSDGSFNDSVQFTIPQKEGTYKVEFELSNGNKVNAGNINVSTVEKTYKAEFQLSDGNTIDGGTFTAPVIEGWKTVWEGSKVVSSLVATTGSFQDDSGMYSGSRTIQHEIISNAYKTRITYTLADESPQTTELESPVRLTAGNNSYVRASIDSSSNNINFVTTIKGTQPNSKVFYTGKTVTLIKVEQFY